MQRPRILYITPQPPYPLTSGMAIRQFNLLRAYAGWGRVKLVFFYRTLAQLEIARALGEYCETIHPFPMAGTLGQTVLAALPRWRRRARLTLARRPSQVTLLGSPEMTRLVEELAQSSDLIHVARLPMVIHVEQLLRDRRGAGRFVLDLDDVETAVQARRLRVLPGRSWGRLALGYHELIRLRAYQARALRLFDRVLVCSTRDRERLGSPNVHVVPNGTAVPAAPLSTESDGRTLLFCGLLSYQPNIDALEFFVGRILPLIRRELPDVRLLVVGRTPAARVLALHDGVTVTVVGDVPSVAEYYQQATVAVVPLRFAGGTRIRILEAWALGVPVVATSQGCEGLEGVDGEHLAVADQPADFARACLALLRSPAARQRLIAGGRDLVGQRYRWDAIGADVVAMARQLLATPSPAVPAGGPMAVGR